MLERPTTDDGAAWAHSGVVALTGHDGGTPFVPPGRGASRAAELMAIITDATGGRVGLDGPRLLSERAGAMDRTRRGRVSVGGSARLLPTADGWAVVSCARPDDLALLGALIGRPLTTAPWPAVAGWLREHPGSELAESAEFLGVAAAPVRPLSSPPMPVPGPPRSVAGLLVVDFSALWAGPLCAHLLGLAGARVVKVETPHRPDGARSGHAGFYRLLHAGHRSVVLDPETSSGRAALAGLVAAADVVVEASRPRALARWGLDADTETSGGTTWVSITAAGRGSARIGFGDDVAAGAGLVALDDGGDPVFCGDALADPLAGLTAAALALTSPAGSLIDVSMADVVGATLDGGPSRAARRGPDGWVVDTEGGVVPVATPVARTPDGHAPAGGADTATVLHELGLAAP